MRGKATLLAPVGAVALAAAALCAAAASASAGIAAEPPIGPSGSAGPAAVYVPGEVIVRREGEPPRVERLPATVGVKDAVDALERSRGIEYAAPNWVARTAAPVAPLDRGTSGTPGGWRADQWSYLAGPGGIRAPAAWRRASAPNAQGGAGATVAVLDTGIAYAQSPDGWGAAPDFAPGQFAAGIDLVDDDAAPLDDNGHGTHVAATIGESITLGAPAAEDDFLTGIAYDARLMPVRVLGSEGAGEVSDVADGILWAAKNGADIINLSLQFDAAVSSCAQVPSLCDAVVRARRLGSLVVAAAGNTPGEGGRARALFPGAAPGVLAVAATTEHGCLAGYSHFGRRVGLLAPGGGAPRPQALRPECEADSRPVLQLSFSCFPGCASPTTEFAIRPDLGTSMAAAHTSGVAALVIRSGALGRDPSPGALARRLRCAARPGEPARFYGDGMLDARRATKSRLRC